MRLNPLHQAIPFGTLATDLFGVFIIGTGLAWFNRMANIDPMWKVLTITGLCGGSIMLFTFSAEVVFLLQEGRFGWAMVSALTNLLGSFVMIVLAFRLASASPAHWNEKKPVIKRVLNACCRMLTERLRL